MNCEQAFGALYYNNSRQGRLEKLAITHQLTYSRCISRLSAVAFSLAFTIPVVAQQVQPPPVDRTNNERRRQQEMSKREYQLRNLGAAGNNAVDDKQKKALMAQVEQDFNRILLLHNQIARAISSETTLDYRFVSDAAGEIKKRSARLQATLALGEPATEKQGLKESTELDKDELRPALLTLCKHIKDFVTNPIIDIPGTVDAEHLVKARRDLASVIMLSGLIRKKADQLGK
jgi:hypothetical protein